MALILSFSIRELYRSDKAMLFEWQTNQSFRRDVWLFVTGMAISLVAKGVALFPFGFSVDSYPKLVAMSENPSVAGGAFEEFIDQGRLGQWLLNKALETLGIIGPGGNTLYVFLTLCCFVAVGVLLCRLWRIENDIVLQICVVGVVAIHPYHAEIFTFREATLCVGVALLSGISGLVVAAGRASRWIVGCILMIFSLTLYQVVFNYVVIALIVLILLELSRLGSRQVFERHPGGDGQQIRLEILYRTTAFVVAVLMYIAVYTLSLKIFGSVSVEAQRRTILPLARIPGRILGTMHILWNMFAVPEALMPTATKLLIGVICILAIVLLTRRIMQTEGPGHYPALAATYILLGIAVFSIVGMGIPLRFWQPFDRVLSAVSVLVAGLLTIAILNSDLWTRRVLLVMAAILLFSFTGVNNVVLSEQLRVNNRDMEKATRMIMRLEAEPEFRAATKLAVVGGEREYPMGFRTVRRGSDMNVSGFARPWSKANLIREVSGYRLIEPSRQERLRAEDYCRDVQPWPGPASVAVLDHTAIICLPDGE